jgi:hypothetical protein
MRGRGSAKLSLVAVATEQTEIASKRQSFGHDSESGVFGPSTHTAQTGFFRKEGEYWAIGHDGKWVLVSFMQPADVAVEDTITEVAETMTGLLGIRARPDHWDRGRQLSGKTPQVGKIERLSGSRAVTGNEIS